MIMIRDIKPSKSNSERGHFNHYEFEFFFNEICIKINVRTEFIQKWVSIFQTIVCLGLKQGLDIFIYEFIGFKTVFFFSVIAED